MTKNGKNLVNDGKNSKIVAKPLLEIVWNCSKLKQLWKVEENYYKSQKFVTTYE